MGELSSDASDPLHADEPTKVDPKLVADQLGHTLDVNQNVYTVPDLSHRLEAVNLLETTLQNA